MHFKEVKGILSSKNRMNLFRGCTNGCIYCDSRSNCYRMNHKFEDVEVKENGISLLEENLKRKRKKCMIGLGASSMKEYILNLEKEFSLIENGFKEEEKRALADYLSNDNAYTKELAFLAFKSNVYQVRMYSVFLFGHLSSYEEFLIFMRDEVSKDDNWRVQEVLAKAFDEFCKQTGYEKSLPVIDEWLQNSNPNVRRAVTEGLRIWTSRPYFKDNTDEAIKRIATLKEDSSEYVRKSVGNA